MDTTITKRLVSIPEARQVLGGIGHTTIYELINRGEIVKVNIGRRGFITADSLDAYVDRITAASAAETAGGAAQ
jgi:hypothetical protein